MQRRRGNRSIRMVVLFVPTGPASEADSAVPRSLIARHQAGDQGRVSRNALGRAVGDSRSLVVLGPWPLEVSG